MSKRSYGAKMLMLKVPGSIKDLQCIVCLDKTSQILPLKGFLQQDINVSYVFESTDVSTDRTILDICALNC